MHANTQNFWCIQAVRVAFGIQRVKAVTQVTIKIIGLCKALRQGKAHVVAVQGVGHHQARHQGAIAARHLHPERQVVAVIVAVVFQPAVIGHQAPGPRAVAAGVPAQRARSGELLNGVEPTAHLLALGRFVNVLVVDPAPAVAGDFMAQFNQGRRDFRIALQRHADTKHRERQLAPFEFAQDTPYTRPRAVFINAFHAQVPVRKTGRVGHFRQELLRASVAMKHRVFAALLVVQDKLQRDARSTGPPGVGRMAAVTSEIARIGAGGLGIHRGIIAIHRKCAYTFARATPYNNRQLSRNAMGLSTHVLDTMHGTPADGMKVALYTTQGGQAVLVKSFVLNHDGRNPDGLLYDSASLQAGTYRLVFDVAAYFRASGVVLPEPPFLDQVTLDFGVADTRQHYHVPLLVSPWSYSTYRGS